MTMKHTLILAAISIGLIVCAVGYSDSKYQTALGRKAPDFYVENNVDTITPLSLKGEYTLVNFWSSTDAPSRKAANEYTAWFRRHPNAHVRLVSVNFDKNEALFNEIMRNDSLDPMWQFHVSGDTARAIADNYGLEDSYGSLLISPEGKIIAHNPEPASLVALK